MWNRVDDIICWRLNQNGYATDKQHRDIGCDLTCDKLVQGTDKGHTRHPNKDCPLCNIVKHYPMSTRIKISGE